MAGHCRHDPTLAVIQRSSSERVYLIIRPTRKGRSAPQVIKSYTTGRDTTWLSQDVHLTDSSWGIAHPPAKSFQLMLMPG